MFLAAISLLILLYYVWNWYTYKNSKEHWRNVVKGENLQLHNKEVLGI